jgi:hypothetical protein
VSRTIAQLVVALVVLLAVSVWAALNAEVFVGDADVVELTAFIMTGPIAGWIIAISQDAVSRALWLLVPSTGLALLLVAGYGYRRDALSLGLAAIWWWVCGWYFAVGMWI